MKGIVVVDMTDACVECPMCYHADDLQVDKYTYKKLYSCRIVPDNVLEVYIDDIIHKKPKWCPIKPIPNKKSMDSGQTVINAARGEGWNDCIDEILKGEK